MRKFLLAVSIAILTSASLFAHKEIVVDLSEQMAYAIEDGYVAFEGRISSGMKGRETPSGDFRIIQKKRHHTSNLWPKPKGGAKMPYMMRLTNSGIAMHLGHVPNKPASHGCIRLKQGFAQKMYKWARVGTNVYVEGDARDYVHIRNRYGDRHYNNGYRVIDYYD